MRNIRNDAVSGMITDIGATETSITFNEWWGKEGMDFTLYNPLDDETKTISLTRDELHCLVVAAIAASYVDGESAIREAKEVHEESEKAKKQNEQDLEHMNRPNPLTGLGNLGALM
jgi:hypothetical protein